MMMYHSSVMLDDLTVMLDHSIKSISDWTLKNTGVSNTPDLLENWRTNVKF